MQKQAALPKFTCELCRRKVYPPAYEYGKMLVCEACYTKKVTR